jgi:hypothetical protein
VVYFPVAFVLRTAIILRRGINMKTFALSLILVSLCLPAAHSKTEVADIIFINGNVYTVSEKAPRAEAIAVKGGKIIYVGQNKSAIVYKGASTRVIDDRRALPPYGRRPAGDDV